MEIQEKSFSESKITLTNRAVLNLTGVEKVFETNQNKIQLKVAGSYLSVGGNDLNISKLDVETGVVEIEGIVSELKYIQAGEKGSLFKRIFK